MGGLTAPGRARCSSATPRPGGASSASPRREPAPGAKWSGGIPPFVHQSWAYHNDTVLRKPDFNEPYGDRSEWRTPCGWIYPDDGTPRAWSRQGDQSLCLVCFPESSPLPACCPTLAMTTGNAGPQAPATGTGNNPRTAGLGATPPTGAATLPTMAGALIKWPDLVAQSGVGPELDRREISIALRPWPSWAWTWSSRRRRDALGVGLHRRRGPHP